MEENKIDYERIRKLSGLSKKVEELLEINIRKELPNPISLKRIIQKYTRRISTNRSRDGLEIEMINIIKELEKLKIMIRVEFMFTLKYTSLYLNLYRDSLPKEDWDRYQKLEKELEEQGFWLNCDNQENLSEQKTYPIRKKAPKSVEHMVKKKKFKEKEVK